jgi:hypothetical protein
VALDNRNKKIVRACSARVVMEAFLLNLGIILYAVTLHASLTCAFIMLMLCHAKHNIIDLLRFCSLFAAGC